MLLTATDPHGLDAICDAFQDGYYELADIDHDAATGVLRIPFRRWSHDEARVVGKRPAGKILNRLLGDKAATKSWEAPWYRWILRVRNVESYALEDVARLGCADLHVIRYDAARSSVILELNFSVEIVARVRSIAVELEQTSELLGMARYETTGDAQSHTAEIFPSA